MAMRALAMSAAGGPACVALSALWLFQAVPAAATTGTAPREVPAGKVVVARLPADFLPEGFAWDARHNRFLLGSIRRQRIVAVDPATGRVTPFASVPGSVLGMHVSRDGSTLWAAWTRFGHAHIHNAGTGLAAWSLANGHRLGSWTVPEADPRGNLGDFTFADTHMLVASDSGTGAVWRFDTRQHRFDVLCPHGRFRSPQGVAAGLQAGTVYLADYPTGLWRIALTGGEATLIAPPDRTNLRGIDGLYRAGTGLIGVQNGTRTPHILAISLDNGDIIRDVHPWHGAVGSEPGLGTVAQGRFWYVANSQWSAYDDDLRPKPGAALQSPRLMSVPISSAFGAPGSGR